MSQLTEFADQTRDVAADAWDHPARLARGLGWFSVGLGAFELLAPGVIGRFLGLPGRTGRIRAFGVRELLQGVLTLAVDEKIGMRSRVAGDVLDIFAVLPALHRSNPKRGNALIAMALLGGVALADWMAAEAIAEESPD